MHARPQLPAAEPVGADELVRQPPGDPAARPTPSQVVAEPVDAAWWQSFNDPILTELEQQVAFSNLDGPAGYRAVAGKPAATRRHRRRTSSRRRMAMLSYDPGKGERPRCRGLAERRWRRRGQFDLGTAANGTHRHAGRHPDRPVRRRRLAGRATMSAASTCSRRASTQPGRLISGAGSAARWRRPTRHDRRFRRDRDGTAMVTVLAELARDYLQYRGRAARPADRAWTPWRATRQSLRLTQERQRGGLTTGLWTWPMPPPRSAITAAHDSATARAGVDVTLNAISLLLGQTPGSLDGQVGDRPASARRCLRPCRSACRPNSRGAGRTFAGRRAQLHAATADIGAAEADFFPKVTLSGSVGVQATQFKDIWAISGRSARCNIPAAPPSPSRSSRGGG